MRIRDHKIAQAVTRHLRVLEHADVVRSVRTGRQSRFELEPRPIEEVRYPGCGVRLKAHVED